VGALLPAIFFGHGNPMNAITQNAYTEAWRRIGEETLPPSAILSISAHWYVPENSVTVTTAPRTVHDFGGFPAELYQVQYPAPGDPALARRIRHLLAPLEVKLDNSWGLDHGTWWVLRHVYPAAEIPFVQLSINETKPGSFQFESLLPELEALYTAVGLFTRPIAFVLSGEMAAAYFIGHVPQGHFLSPSLNQGTLAVLYCFIFLFLQRPERA
jgi:aromatic ring-opening dioxygenase catalytic subunit (LigB family)